MGGKCMFVHPKHVLDVDYCFWLALPFMYWKRELNLKPMEVIARVVVYGRTTILLDVLLSNFIHYHLRYLFINLYFSD